MNNEYIIDKTDQILSSPNQAINMLGSDKDDSDINSDNVSLEEENIQNNSSMPRQSEQQFQNPLLKSEIGQGQIIIQTVQDLNINNQQQLIIQKVDSKNNQHENSLDSQENEENFYNFKQFENKMLEDVVEDQEQSIEYQDENAIDALNQEENYIIDKFAESHETLIKQCSARIVLNIQMIYNILDTCVSKDLYNKLQKTNISRVKTKNNNVPINKNELKLRHNLSFQYKSFKLWHKIMVVARVRKKDYSKYNYDKDLYKKVKEATANNLEFILVNKEQKQETEQRQRTPPKLQLNGASVDKQRSKRLTSLNKLKNKPQETKLASNIKIKNQFNNVLDSSENNSQDNSDINEPAQTKMPLLNNLLQNMNFGNDQNKEINKPPLVRNNINLDRRNKMANLEQQIIDTQKILQGDKKGSRLEKQAKNNTQVSPPLATLMNNIDMGQSDIIKQNGNDTLHSIQISKQNKILSPDSQINTLYTINPSSVSKLSQNDGPPPLNRLLINNDGPPPLNNLMTNNDRPSSLNSLMINNNGPPTLNKLTINNEGPPPLNILMINNDGPPPFNSLMMNNDVPSPLNSLMMNNDGPPPISSLMCDMVNIPPPLSGPMSECSEQHSQYSNISHNNNGPPPISNMTGNNIQGPPPIQKLIDASNNGPSTISNLIGGNNNGPPSISNLIGLNNNEPHISNPIGCNTGPPPLFSLMSGSNDGPPPLSSMIKGNPDPPNLSSIMDGPPPLSSIMGGPPPMSSLIEKVPPLSSMMGGPPPLSSMMGGPPPISSMMEGPPSMSSMMGKPPPLSSMMGGPPPISSMMGGPPPISSMMGGPPPISSMMGGPPPMSSMMGGPPPISTMMGGPPPLLNMIGGPPPMSNMMGGPPPISNMMGGPPSMSSMMGPPPQGMMNQVQQQMQPQQQQAPPPPKDQIPKRVQLNAISKFKLKTTFWALPDPYLDPQQKYKALKIDYNILISHFFQKQQEPTPGQDKKKDIKIAPKADYLIDQKKANNCAIIMNSFSLNQEEIIAALKELNHSVLDSEFLDKLTNFLPLGEDEIKKLKNFKGKIETILSCEQLIYKMYQIPRCKQRIDSLKFKINFEADYNEYQNKLANLDAPFIMLKDDPSFKLFMKLLLGVANYLNQGTSKANAMVNQKFSSKYQGLTIDSLTYLDTVKSYDKKYSMIKFLALCVKNSEIKIYQFWIDFLTYKESNKIEIGEIETKSKEFIRGVEKLKDECNNVQKLIESGTQDDNLEALQKFIKFFKTYSENCDEKMENFMANLEKLKKNIQIVGQMFGEQDKYNPTDFLSQLFTFGSKFKGAYIELILFDEQQQKEREKQKEKEEQEKEQQLKKSQQIQPKKALNPQLTRSQTNSNMDQVNKKNSMQKPLKYNLLPNSNNSNSNGLAVQAAQMPKNSVTQSSLKNITRMSVTKQLVDIKNENHRQSVRKSIKQNKQTGLLKF